MKRKYILTLSILLFLFLYNAHKATSQIRFGIRGGIDVISHKINTDILKVNNRLGYQIGGTIEALVPATGLGGELSILYGRQEHKVEEMNNDPTISNFDYISIPLSIKKRINFTSLFGIFASAGVYADIRIQNGNLNTTFGKFKTKDYAAGVQAGFGARLLDNFDLGLYYRCQLTDNYADKTPEIENLSKKRFQFWSVGLTYFF